MRQGAARRLAACVACAPARPTWVGAKLAFSLFPQFLLPPALENWNGLVFLFCLAWFFRFCFLACLSWWFFKFFADSGQVFGGVCLRRFKTVLDTLRHSSQLPCIGIGEFTKELLRHVFVSIRLESTSHWQPAEFYSHKARAPPVASDLVYQTGVP